MVTDVVKAWDEITRRLREVVVKKDHDYGSAWLRCGKIGLVVRMIDKMERLTNIIKNEDVETPAVNESITETAMDLSNYANFLAIASECGMVWDDRNDERLARWLERTGSSSSG